MSRPEAQRLEDIRKSCGAILDYLHREDVSEEIVFDAMRMRLVEVGEAVKDLGSATRDREPGIPWSDIAGMRDFLAHHYFDTAHAVVASTARNEIPELLAAVERLLSADATPQITDPAQHREPPRFRP